MNLYIDIIFLSILLMAQIRKYLACKIVVLKSQKLKRIDHIKVNLCALVISIFETYIYVCHLLTGTNINIFLYLFIEVYLAYLVVNIRKRKVGNNSINKNIKKNIVQTFQIVLTEAFVIIMITGFIRMFIARNFAVSFKVFGISCISTYLIILIYDAYQKKKKKQNNLEYDIIVKLTKESSLDTRNSKVLSAYLDTGNTARYKGRVVSFIKESTYLKLTNNV